MCIRDSYYIARVTLALMHASDLDRTRNRVGLAWLLGLEVFSNWASTAWDGHRVFLVGYLAWGLALYSLVMIGWLSWEAREAETASEPTPAP